MADLKSLAVAKWRLEKWLENAEVEKKLPAESSLRVIDEYLTEQNITIVDLTGYEYDPGLAVDVVCVEAPKSRSRKPSMITEMLSPIVLINGEVSLRGQVIISKPFSVKKKIPSSTKKTTTRKKKASDKT